MKLKGSRRLTSLFAHRKRKKSIAALNTWSQLAQHGAALERGAAAVQVQRAARGFLGRGAAARALRLASAAERSENESIRSIRGRSCSCAAAREKL
jgi:hypothetical protein